MVERLAKAPIHEAIIDIKCGISEEIPTTNLKFDDSARREAINLFKAEIKAGDTADPFQSSASQFLIGYKYTDLHAGIIAQFRRDGVTTSKIHPYDTWETFLPEAKSNWNRYKKATNSDTNSVTRVAVRYINRLCVPINDYIVVQDYLRNAPETPDEANRPAIDEFLCRMVLPIPEIDGKAVLISTMGDIVKNEDGEFLPLILDIDVFHMVHENVPESEKQMWSIINRMRDVKNEMFFNVMTPEALELCR